MHKSLAQAHIPLARATSSAEPNPGDPAWRDWAAHVEAGRIGVSCRSTAPLHETSGSGTTRAQLARHVRNEMVLLGRGRR